MNTISKTHKATQKLNKLVKKLGVDLIAHPENLPPEVLRALENVQTTFVKEYGH